MSVTIAQDKEQVRLAYSIQRQACMDLMSLAKMLAICKIEFQDATLPVSFLLDFLPDKAVVKERRLSALVQFTLRLKDEKDLELVSLDCAIRAEYELNEGYHPTAEELEAFA